MTPVRLHSISVPMITFNETPSDSLEQAREEAAKISWQARFEQAAVGVESFAERRGIIFIAAFAGVYLTITLYRAATKLFWFDELFTVYLSRLSDARSLWAALLNGSDFNPPLFYILTRFGGWAGAGDHVGVRVPEVVGFGIFCLCLFRFVALRSTVLGGLVAMIFPLVTTAYAYAYEARPHGVVLGFCGLALICWQQAADEKDRSRSWWLLGLAASLAGALLNHAYAVLLFVPLALGELARLVRRRRIDWPMMATLLIAGAVGVALVYPLAAIASKVGLAGDSATHFGFSLSSVPTRVLKLYAWLLGPGTFALAAAALIFAWCGASRPSRLLSKSTRGLDIPSYELIVLWGFLGIPIFAIVVSLATRTILYDRYTISAIAGFAGLVGLAAARRPLVATLLFFVLSVQVAGDGIKYMRNVLVPSPLDGVSFHTHRPDYLKRFELFTVPGRQELPIVILEEFEFVPMAYYAPAAVVDRFTYLLRSSRDINGIGYRKLIQCCGARGNVMEKTEFLASHDRFLVYGSPRALAALGSVVVEGSAVSVVDASAEHFLAYVGPETVPLSIPALRR